MKSLFQGNAAFIAVGGLVFMVIMLLAMLLNTPTGLQFDSLDAQLLITNPTLKFAYSLSLIAAMLAMYKFGSLLWFRYIVLFLLAYIAFYIIYHSKAADNILLLMFVGVVAIFILASNIGLIKNLKYGLPIINMIVVLTFITQGLTVTKELNIEEMDDIGSLNCQMLNDGTLLDPQMEQLLFEMCVQNIQVDTHTGQPAALNKLYLIALFIPLLGIVVFILYWQFAARRTQQLEVETIGEQLRRSLQTSLEHFDFSQSGKGIIDCYHALLMVLQEHALVKSQSATAREFNQRLIELGFPAELMQQFTLLFEQAKYQSAELDAQKSQQAYELLTQLVQFIEVDYVAALEVKAHANE